MTLLKCKKLLLVLLLLGLLLPNPVYAYDKNNGHYDYNGYDVVDAVNDYRLDKGLAPLLYHHGLTRAAYKYGYLVYNGAPYYRNGIPLRYCYNNWYNPRYNGLNPYDYVNYYTGKVHVWVGHPHLDHHNNYMHVNPADPDTLVDKWGNYNDRGLGYLDAVDAKYVGAYVYDDVVVLYVGK